MRFNHSQSLRTRYAGSVGLDEQRRLQQTLTKLNNDRKAIRGRLLEALDAAEQAQQRADELTIKQRTMDEMISAMNGG